MEKRLDGMEKWKKSGKKNRVEQVKCYLYALVLVLVFVLPEQ